MLYPLALLLVLLLAFVCFTLVGNLLLAPFHGLLAERVERALTGRTLSSPIAFGWAFIRRTVSQEARRLAYVVALLLGVFVLGLVPVVGLIAVPLGLVLGAWLLALEFAANPMGNWGWDVARQRAFLRARRFGFLGFGFSAMGLSLVPVLNLALLPAAVAGMTAYCIRLRDAQDVRPASDSRAG
jgi:CysZ protein